MRNHDPRTPPGTNDDIAERVKRERAVRGWSLRELERRMGEAGEPMSFSVLQRLENGRGADKSRPSVTFDQARALAEVFDLPFNEFVAPASWVREQEAKRLRRSLVRSIEKLEQGVVELIAASRQLALIDEKVSDLLDQRSWRLNTRLTIPSAAGLQEYFNGLVGTAQMLGLQLGYETYRTEEWSVRYPNASNPQVLPPFGKFEGPMSETDDWAAYLPQLEAAVQAFAGPESTPEGQLRSTR